MSPARQSLRVTVLVFKQRVFCLLPAPKGKIGNAGDSDMPKRSLHVLLLSKKVKVPNKRKKKKKRILFSKIHGNNESSIREIVKKEKKNHVSLLRKRTFP